MRRVLLMFLLVLLPFQYVWAAAAPYCQHEQTAAQHVGHHEHKHQRSAKAGSTAGEPADAGQLSASLDDDCGYCQQSASKPILSGVSGLVIAGGLPLQPRASPALPSRDPDRVERPNWRRLV